MFTLSKRSRERLQGVHPELVRLVYAVIKNTPIEFSIIEGVRSKERQEQLFAKKATKTMNSRHLTGHAIDFACFVGNELRWDWPLYTQVGQIFKECAKEIGVPIVWGGDWKTFPDGPHIELDRKFYP